MSLFATGDLIQLVANLLYSGYVPIQTQGSVHLLNCRPAATPSLFVEEFLNVCFRPMRFWLESFKSNVNFFVSWQQKTTADLRFLMIYLFSAVSLYTTSLYAFNWKLIDWRHLIALLMHHSHFEHGIWLFVVPIFKATISKAACSLNLVTIIFVVLLSPTTVFSKVIVTSSVALISQESGAHSTSLHTKPILTVSGLPSSNTLMALLTSPLQSCSAIIDSSWSLPVMSISWKRRVFTIRQSWPLTYLMCHLLKSKLL